MPYVIGFFLAAAVCAFGLLVGFDRDRAFYPTMLIVVGTYYVLFAVMANSIPALTMECLAAGVFVMLAIAGFKKSLWLAAAGLVGHGVFDGFHHTFIQNSGVPLWWPGFCLSFDILAGLFLGVLLVRRSGSAPAASAL